METLNTSGSRITITRWLKFDGCKAVMGGGRWMGKVAMGGRWMGKVAMGGLLLGMARFLSSNRGEPFSYMLTADVTIQ